MNDRPSPAPLAQPDDGAFVPGDRVELTDVTEDYLRYALRPGDLGTVQFTDSLGTVHIRWDPSGNRIGIIAEAARLIRKISGIA